MLPKNSNASTMALQSNLEPKTKSLKLYQEFACVCRLTDICHEFQFACWYKLKWILQICPVRILNLLAFLCIVTNRNLSITFSRHACSCIVQDFLIKVVSCEKEIVLYHFIVFYIPNPVVSSKLD